MVRSLIVVLTIATVAYGIPSVFNFKKFLNLKDPDTLDFSNLVDKLRFNFKDEKDVGHRLVNFRKAKDEIAGLQKRYKNAKFGHNKFSLMSDEERKQVITEIKNNVFIYTLTVFGSSETRRQTSQPRQLIISYQF